MNEEHGTEMDQGAEEETKAPEVIPAFSSLDDEKIDFELPVGSWDLAGNYYRKVQISELGPKVRRKIGRPDILNHPGKLTTHSLALVLGFPHYQFADEKQERKVLVRSMYSADRSACVLAIRKVTKGEDSEIVQRSECGFCGNRVDIFTAPSEIKTVRIEDTGYKKDDTLKEWVLVVEAFGHTARLKLARGFEEEGLSVDQIRNINDSSMAVLAACTIDFDGDPVDFEFYDRLRTKISDAIMDQFLDNQPGPDVFSSVRCNSCNRTFDYGVDPSDFLLPSAGQRRFGRRGGRSRN